MKMKAILTTATMIFVMAITSFGQMAVQPVSAEPVSGRPITGKPGLGQILKQKAQEALAQANTPIPTASEVLANIIAADNIVPLELYPSGYLDQLRAMGNQPMYTIQAFDPNSYVLKPGDKANMAWMDATFTMGSPTSEAERQAYSGIDESQHTVAISYGFYMGQYQVTQSEYQSVVGSNPSYYTPANGYSADLNRPVEQVSWYDATNYCYLLTQQALANGSIPVGWAYRLPTEAEWEYSARAGTTTAFSFGNSITGGDGNFADNDVYNAATGSSIVTPTIAPLNMTCDVGSYSANPFGLYDMVGNVREWCGDLFDSGDTYPTGTVIDPQGPTSGGSVIVRNGDYGDGGVVCRSAARISSGPSAKAKYIGFRTVLAPVVPEWKSAVTATPSQPVLGQYPIKESDKDSLIVVTHGWINRFESLVSPPNQTWIDTMSNNIDAYLALQGTTNWQVFGYKWENNAWAFQAQTALYNARGEGVNLGSAIAVQGWSHVHFIGHSAGAEVIQAATEWIKAVSPSTTVECTFLDPFVGNDFAGVSNYGNGSDWSDSYFTHDVTGATTEAPLDDAYNVNVTYLDPSKTPNSKFYSSQTGEPCHTTVSSHGWPIDFYMNTITGATNSDYAGFGFQLSREAGGFDNALANYSPGNGTVGNAAPTKVLGTPDPDCDSGVVLTPPSSPNTVPDFTQLPTIESLTGTIQKYVDHLNLLSGSPAWVSAVMTITNPVNFVSFDAEFTSSAGAQGLLTILWDTNTIGTIDERVDNGGFEHYQYSFPNTASNETHVLSFRLDPFTSVQSKITLTNIVLNQVGPDQPFSLSVTTNTPVNGSLVFQLTGPAGFGYSIQTTTNLAGTNWTDIAELLNTNGIVLFYDQESTNYPMRFYRGIVPSISRAVNP